MVDLKRQHRFSYNCCTDFMFISHYPRWTTGRPTVDTGRSRACKITKSVTWFSIKREEFWFPRVDTCAGLSSASAGYAGNRCTFVLIIVFVLPWYLFQNIHHPSSTHLEFSKRLCTSCFTEWNEYYSGALTNV
jgi:hypothetical protein